MLIFQCDLAKPQLKEGEESNPLPAVPGAIIAKSDSNGIRISWKGDTTKSDILGYIVFRSMESLSSSLESIATVVDTYFVDQVPDNSLYYYSVISYNELGRSGYSEFAGPLRIPSIPQPVREVVVTGEPNGISLSWRSDTLGDTAIGYAIYRSLDSTLSADSIATVLTPSYFDTVSSAARYYYAIAPFNNAGKGALPSLSKSNSAMLCAPRAPVLISASDGSHKRSVFIVWRKSVGADAYYIYRNRIEDDLANYTRVGISSDTTFADSTDSDEFLYYRIKSMNSAGFSAMSTVSSGGFIKPTGIPSTPTIGIASSYSGNAFQGHRISYNVQNSYYVNGFLIYRKGPDETSFALLDTIGITENVTSGVYLDEGPFPYTCPEKYEYSVAAYNLTGQSQNAAPKGICH